MESSDDRHRHPRGIKVALRADLQGDVTGQLVESSAAVLAKRGVQGSVFVRPDSPLKPFSGRVLSADNITLPALDHGFYFEDEQLPVVIAPARAIGAEWRFVVVNGEVVTGSGHIAEGRRAGEDAADSPAWRLAAEIAREMPLPEPVVVLGICEVDGALRLLELNPFSGADLYDCDLTAVVSAVGAFLEEGS